MIATETPAWDFEQSVATITRDFQFSFRYLSKISAKLGAMWLFFVWKGSSLVKMAMLWICVICSGWVKGMISLIAIECLLMKRLRRRPAGSLLKTEGVTSGITSSVNLVIGDWSPRERCLKRKDRDKAWVRSFAVIAPASAWRTGVGVHFGRPVEKRVIWFEIASILLVCVLLA